MQSKRIPLQTFAVALVTFSLQFASCGGSPRQKEAAFLERGKKQLANADYHRAILEFKNAAQAGPNDAEPLYQMGLAYWGLNRFNEAYAVLKKAAELDPRHTGAQTKLAELMAMSRDPKMVNDARERAAKAAAASPHDPEALYALAFSEYRLGNTKNAEGRLEETLRKFPDNLQSAVGLANLRLQRKDFGGAEQILKKAASQSGGSVPATMALGQVYELQGKTAEAEAAYRDVLRLDSKNGPALVQIGGLQIRAGRKQEAEQTFKTVSTLPGKEFEPMYAFFLFGEGRTDAAVSEFRRLALKDPKDRLARSRLVTACITRNKFAEAKTILDKAIETNQKDTSALFQRSQVYIKQRHFAEAQRDLSEVLRYQPERAEAHFLLSEIHRSRGENLLQDQELHEALRVKPGLLPARVGLAYSLVAAKHANAALKVLDEIPQEQKEAPEVAAARNWVLLASKNTEEARKSVDRGLSQARTPDLVLQEALLNIEQNQHEKARASLETLLKKTPDNVNALNLLVRSYAQQKQPAIAAAKFREYTAAAPGSFPIQMFAANWFVKNQMPADARHAIAAAKNADPKSVVPDIVDAQIDWAEGKRDSARTKLSAVVSSNPGNGHAHLLLAMLEENSGRSEEAIKHYRKVVELEPKQVIALNGLAYQLGAYTSNVDEALRYAQQAKDLDPDNPAVDDTLGWILYRKGSHRAAVGHLQAAASKTADPVIKYHLAMAYFKTGDMNRGEQTLSVALKANPDLPEAALAQKARTEAMVAKR